jgi:quercetin dioxygenase-like cupin family protein
MHTQNREEVMVQLSGTITLTSGEMCMLLRPGDVAIIPANTPHRLDNTGDVDAEWLIVSAAGVQFFRENGEEARPGWAQ